MLIRTIALGAAVAALLGALPAPAQAATPGPRATLSAYASEAEMVQALTRWRTQAEALRRPIRREALGSLATSSAPSPSPAAAPPAAAEKAAMGAADKAAMGAADKAAEFGAASDSITNVQTAGVDEGGIVKRAGDHLVILRRGRLFSVRVGGDALQAADMTNAYAPGADPRGAWYDELLISGSTVVVVGYSYARGGTEIGLFELGRDGSLAYRATYHLRSFDYYSARNYASRLIGRTLVFYTPTVLQPWGPRPWEQMPGFRRWQGDAAPVDFTRILPATRIYRSDDDFDPAEPLALHTVTRCELGSAQMSCESSAVLGAPGRVFYVAGEAVYVWTAPQRRRPSLPGANLRPRASAAVFRIPLDGAAPAALKAAGMPIDPMSFLEDPSGHLNVLLSETGDGDAMGGNERTRGGMALLRVPLSAFGDGQAMAQREHYRRLPGLNHGAVQNRYVGDWLLWGAADGGREEGGRRRGSTAWALRFANRDEPAALDPGHAVERIEALGRHALLVGNTGGDLVFSSVNLAPGGARIASRYVQTGAQQGETRTHGFFYQPSSADEGLLGLPILGPGAGTPRSAYGGAQGSASVLFLRQRDLSFDKLGQLSASARVRQNDGCQASCVDWYGNARPIFLGGRVFALMGYELVEGQRVTSRWSDRLDERRRIDLAPGSSRREGLYSPFD